ncbi:MmgE/PrpD family protein [Microcella sp.]|uniref:MmgE/PrpD family protein n=1 Tax=Microcella sp. TaxID=1913979 RepID=UPI0025670558|nr:MmgE/PrpD family protein [Microcella sp.]MBX9472359.1 MmgE/PrpD family protein [Microcella sp.]
MTRAPKSDSLAEVLVELLADISAKSLPDSTRDSVARNSLQVFGVMRLGLQNPIGRDSVEYTAKWESGSAATIVAHGKRSGTCAGAAFANAVAAHSDFREDTHAGSSSHPGVVVIPAVFAVAEAMGGTLPPGRYAEAVVAGHELIGRLGGPAAERTTARGFRPPSVYTVFGGTLAAALAMGLTQEQQVHALAIAAQGASGITHPFLAGSDEWFLAPALAARHAVMSAMLAAEGVEGSRFALEGPEGVFVAFAGETLPVDLRPAGHGGFEIERARLKAALTCGWNQSLVHQLREFNVRADHVSAVRVRLSTIAGEYPGVASAGPFPSRSAALLSAPWAAALQLVRGSLDHSGYDDLEDPELLEVARRVDVTPTGDLPGYATEVAIDLTDGTTRFSADGNDNPAFSLDTRGRVLEALHRNYASSGLDESRVDVLDAAMTNLLETGSTANLAAAIGEAD